MIETVCEYYDDWIKMAKPGEMRPKPKTAHNYKCRLRQLADLLDVSTVGELRDSMNGLTPEKLDVTNGNFVCLLRGAAGPFWPKSMSFYKEVKNCDFLTPFPSLPTVLKRRRFRPPAWEVIPKLIADAESELRGPDLCCYLLFLLALGAGLRQQEAAHVRWEDVMEDGIWVRSDDVHETKGGDGRMVRLSERMIGILESYRGLPQSWLIPDIRVRNHPLGPLPEKRCIDSSRRLAKWIRNKLDQPDLKNPCHWLRKIFGSVMATKHGTYTASRLLGHADEKTTREVYAGLFNDGPRAEVI